MRLAEVFRNLVLSEVTALPTARTGRPQALQADVAIDHIFTLLPTGMQWRELTTVSYTTVFRRFHTCAGVFQRAYTRALRTYRRLHPNEQ